MKRNSLFHWLVLWIILSVIMIIRADDNQPILSGHASKVEDLVARADNIFTAEIGDLGVPSLKAVGQAKFWGLKLGEIHNLKGHIAAGSKFLLVIDTFQEETAPLLNKPYIFFGLSGEPVSYVKILKLEEASAANVAKVQALIAALPADK